MARPERDPGGAALTGTPAGALRERLRAVFFDVFGTLVDWRSGVAREARALAARQGLALDAAGFADAWRGLYQPSMEQVRRGTRPWVRLEQLHRENLDEVLERFGLGRLAPPERERLVGAWERLDPWPDVRAGLARIKSRYIIAPVSNANVALAVRMARHAGLPWDVILGAEVARAYKPLPRAYLAGAELLDLAPGECLMVAAHNADLHAARGCGLATAFVARPGEHGPAQRTDLRAEPGCDLAVGGLGELADLLGC